MRCGHVHRLVRLAVDAIGHFLERRQVTVRRGDHHLFDRLGQIGSPVRITLDGALCCNHHGLADELVAL